MTTLCNASDVTIVEVVSITGARRRLLEQGIRVDFSIKSDNETKANLVKESITEANVKVQLEKAGLPSAVIVSAPKLSVSTVGFPPWGQPQYRHCQPVFDSWTDMRMQRREGSVVVKTGGLGDLMIDGEYETWTCVYDDACGLGGDYFFCYVFQEQLQQFVPWDQHFNLRLFQPK